LENIIEDKCAMLKIHLALNFLQLKKESKRQQKKARNNEPKITRIFFFIKGSKKRNYLTKSYEC